MTDFRAEGQPTRAQLQSPPEQRATNFSEASGEWSKNLFDAQQSVVLRAANPTRADLELTNDGAWPVWVQIDQPAAPGVGVILRPNKSISIRSTQDVFICVDPSMCLDTGSIYALAFITYRETLLQ